MLRRPKLLYFAFAIAVIVMGASAYWMIRGVVEESQRIESFTRDSIVGLTSHSNKELFSLLDALYQIRLGNEDVDKQTVITKYDIFWSRITTLTSGNVGRNLSQIEGTEEILANVKEVLADTENAVLTLDESDQATIIDLIAQFKSLLPLLNDLRIKTVHRTNVINAQLFGNIEEVGLWSKILLPSMLLSGFIVAIIFYRDRKALNDLTLSLEQRVEERTHELQETNESLKAEMEERKLLEEKLIQSQKMEVVGQLTGGIAHDFNNLLAVIQGNAELLEVKADEHVNKFLRPILRATERGGELTQRLLAFSRRQPLDTKAVDLYVLANDLKQLLHRAMRAENDIRIEIHNDLWLALGDAGQIENAILNLAINADHAMPKGGTLTITLANCVLSSTDLDHNEDAEPGEFVMLSITDTGIGMDEETVLHAFEPFFTTKEVGKGSGLGLSMVYGFIRQSKGHISIESELGKGTTVRVYLPRAQSESIEKTDEDELSAELNGFGELVLILEDDPDVMQSMNKSLSSLNYKVVSAYNLKDAEEEIYGPNEFDVILSDLALAEGERTMDFFANLKNELGHTKVIFMTGHSLGGHDGGVQTENHPFILYKPFKRRELAGMLRRAIAVKMLNS